MVPLMRCKGCNEEWKTLYGGYYDRCCSLYADPAPGCRTRALRQAENDRRPSTTPRARLR